MFRIEAPLHSIPDDEALTPDQLAALRESVARGKAQDLAGEAIPGEAVFAWLRSWGSENELPTPTRKARGSK
jgi:predicted transcriptional regulator